MHTNKSAAVVVAGAVALELVLTDSEHRKKPHAHDAEYQWPRPAGNSAIENQSTASAMQFTPLSGIATFPAAVVVSSTFTTR